jgi:hypothetical protein
VSTFWAAIKLGWLRRLNKTSFWKTLHIEDIKDKSLVFNPHHANELLIKKALKNMQNPVNKQIYISLLNCKSNLIEMDPTQSLFLPLFGEHKTTKNNTPARCEWAMGSRMIDLFSSCSTFLPDTAFIKNARRQPSLFQISTLKNRVKPSYISIHKNAECRQLRETCPFNIYGRIVYKTKKGCSYYYSLLNFKPNKTLLWEKSRMSLERDWEKQNIHLTIKIADFEEIIKTILNMKHHNYLKQFMIKLFRNNLYFKNVTSKFTDTGLQCHSCKTNEENRTHFFLCKIHNEILQKLFKCFINLKILKRAPEISPFFFNNTMPINHPSNILFIAVAKFMYNLRYSEEIPNLQRVKYHVMRFVCTAIEMYPSDPIWKEF